jgi:hypothetical protein
MVRPNKQKKKRLGAGTAVEMAIVMPALAMFVLGMAIGGMGIFRYQALSLLAREAARYATVHGTGYENDTGNPPVTKTDIYSAAVVPMSSGLDLSQVTYSIIYNGASSADWDSVVHAPQFVSGTSGGTPRTATVTVMVNFNWAAPMYFGTINLSSTSVMPMSY